MTDHSDRRPPRLCEAGCESPDCRYCERIRQLVAAAPLPTVEQAQDLRLLLSPKAHPVSQQSAEAPPVTDSANQPRLSRTSICVGRHPDGALQWKDVKDCSDAELEAFFEPMIDAAVRCVPQPKVGKGD